MESTSYIKASGLSGLHKTYKTYTRGIGVGFVGFPFREPDEPYAPADADEMRAL